MRHSLKVNKNSQELYVLDSEGRIVETMKCSTGHGSPTKYGKGTTPSGFYPITRIEDGREVAKILDQTEKWNPYGPYCIDLNIPGRNIAIHGTDEPEKLGKPITSGCIRVSNDDIEKIVKDYAIVGTFVDIIETPKNMRGLKWD